MVVMLATCGDHDSRVRGIMVVMVAGEGPYSDDGLVRGLMVVMIARRGTYSDD